MNADQLQAAIAAADTFSQAQLLQLVRECKVHLDLRQRTIEGLAHSVVGAKWSKPESRGLTSAPGLVG